MDSPPATRPAFPVARSRAATRAPHRSSSVVAPSRLAACLRRCDAAGFRLVVTAPSNTTAFAESFKRFPDRQISRGAHTEWDAAYRLFSGREKEPFDRGSWRVLAVDRDDRVVGAISARFFCGEFVSDYLHTFSLFETTGPVFREHCELAVAEAIAKTLQAGRTPAEISHWAVAPGWHAALIAVTLMRALAALAAAFDAPLALVAADNRRGEVTRLMRLGSAPLGLAGRFCLPPFVDHSTGAWLRLLLVDTATFHARSGSVPAADLALLRERAAIVSAA